MLSFHETIFSKLIRITAGFCLIVTIGAGSVLSVPLTLSGTITADSLRVREKPDSRSAVVTTLPKGTTIAIHNHLKGWYEIMIGDRRGFISDRFAKVEVPSGDDDADPSRNLEKTQQMQRQVGKITHTLARHQSELKSVTQQEASVLTLLDRIDQSLNQSRKQADTLHRDLDVMKQNIDETLSASEDLSIRLKSGENIAGKRVAALFKMNGIGRANFLMSAESLQDWTWRRFALRRILENDEKMLQQLKKDKETLQQLYDKQKSQYTEKQNLEKSYADQIRTVEAEKNNKKKLLAEIRSQKAMEIRAISELKQAADRLNATIESLNQENPPPEASASLVGEDFISSKGLLRMPVKGKIVSKFGDNIVSRLNMEIIRNGIDIQADRGEPVRTVYSGRVLFSDWYKGYGNLIIIDHGDHYYSVYAHLEDRFKSKGQKVETGETIGTAGDAGSVTGPGLYFELRHRGKPMDPMEWIKTD